jgi:16S rRNA (cytosine967-C5)-methyltransferase
MPHEPITVSPARYEAFRILVRVERDGAFAAPLLASDRLAHLTPEDRRLAHELVLGVIRWRGELDYLINATADRPAEKLDLAVRVALWLGLYQLRHLARVPEHAAVSESVEIVKSGKRWRAAPLVNAALRKAARDRPEAPDERVRDSLNRLSISLSHPRWMLERWTARLGEAGAANLARADNEPPSHAFRVNALRAPSLARVMTELAGEGVETRESALIPGARVVTAGHLTPASRAVREGWVYLQDEASQLVASLVGARSGERVLDVGAAPGGKSSQLAAAMGNSGLVVAVDLHPARLTTLAATCQRLAARIVRPLAADAAADLPFAPRVAFDRVLVDAPCSGTGTLRRNPEIKWRLSATDPARFADLQSALLDCAAERVRPRGRLVYSTCSLEPEEDEAVANAFLDRHIDFALVPGAVPETLRTEDGFLRTWPHVHGTDGFFAAVFERTMLE